MKGLTEGSLVLYVLESGRSQGQSRPAIVVRDWVHAAPSDRDGVVNLQVFTDGENDFSGKDDHKPLGVPPVIWRTSIHYSETKEDGTWHWPKKD